MMKLVTARGKYQNTFSIVCNSPETNVTSFPVLVTANDFCDNLSIF